MSSLASTINESLAALDHASVHASKDVLVSALYHNSMNMVWLELYNEEFSISKQSEFKLTENQVSDNHKRALKYFKNAIAYGELHML